MMVSSSGGHTMRILVLAACVAALAAPIADAKTLRWSSQGDYLTADPMAQNELLTNSINGHVYESLIVRGKKLELIPGLAVAWKQTSPTTWVFNLRRTGRFTTAATSPPTTWSSPSSPARAPPRSEGHTSE